MSLSKQSVLALAAVVLAAVAWLIWHPSGEAARAKMGLASVSADQRGGGRPGFARGAPLVVTDAVGQAVINDRLTAVGDGVARRSVTINPEVNGRIVAVLRQSGDRVKAGDVIARLDDSAERIALDRARLAVRDADNQLNRVTQMERGNSISQVERTSAESELEKARLQLREAELALERRTIRAPFEGVLGLLSIQPGSLVNTQNAVTQLDDRSNIMVDFRVPERFVGAFEEGAKVAVTPVANPAMTLTGTITAIDSRLELDSRTLRVQAMIDNQADVLRPGMSFVLDMNFAGQSYPTVNPLAIQWRTEGSYVWRIVADADGNQKAERVPVQIIQRNADAVLVAGSLQSGEQVVTEGVQSVRPGAPVRLAQGG